MPLSIGQKLFLKRSIFALNEMRVPYTSSENTFHASNSACHLRRAIALARHRSRKINLRRTINGSPAHEKSLTSSKNKKHMFHLQFIFWELKNFYTKQLRLESQTTNMIVFTISVWDIVRPLLLAAPVIVYLQSKFEESFYLCRD